MHSPLSLLFFSADLNAKTGVGAIYDPSGRLVYRGSVKAGEADGSGTLHLPNGEKIRKVGLDNA